MLLALPSQLQLYQLLLVQVTVLEVKDQVAVEATATVLITRIQQLRSQTIKIKSKPPSRLLQHLPIPLKRHLLQAQHLHNQIL